MKIYEPSSFYPFVTTTGLVTRKCYATAYGDCDGGPATREHWISKALLERIQDDGTGLLVAGLSWFEGERATVELTTRMLCGRHNHMLHDLDGAIMALHDALLAVAEGKETRITIPGEYLERWAFKVLVGMIVSGAARIDGRNVKATPPQAVLDVLFGITDLPEGEGSIACPTTASATRA